ncbi:hypothetical protein GHT06_022010 [Daphnia sinensis]|uniref:Uncharacterized protein n=1 Tax=Daphnia sinensis TaxID=1820382 RepID=A0AAD5KGP1_9CRUS|nr:hypothetical protein GHT06_022010 [Daphnia sinensis]
MGLLICPLNPVVESRLQPSSDTLLCSRAFLTSSTFLLTCSLQSQQLSSSSVALISPSTTTTTTS